MQQLWSFAKKAPAFWTRDFCVTEDLVIGTWFALNKDTGEVRWNIKDADKYAANRILDVYENIIVATEQIYEGMCVFSSGLYRVDLLSGRRLDSGQDDYLVKRSRYLFFERTQYQQGDAPVLVKDGAIKMRSGRLINALSGEEIASADFDAPSALSEKDLTDSSEFDGVIERIIGRKITKRVIEKNRVFVSSYAANPSIFFIDCFQI